MYIRKARLKLWDVTAGFHIAKNAGLNIIDENGNNIYKYFLSKRYIKEISDQNFKINEFIVSNFNFNWLANYILSNKIFYTIYIDII